METVGGGEGVLLFMHGRGRLTSGVGWGGGQRANAKTNDANHASPTVTSDKIPHQYLHKTMLPSTQHQPTENTKNKARFAPLTSLFYCMWEKKEGEGIYFLPGAFSALFPRSARFLAENKNKKRRALTQMFLKSLFLSRKRRKVT